MTYSIFLQRTRTVLNHSLIDHFNEQSRVALSWYATMLLPITTKQAPMLLCMLSHIIHAYFEFFHKALFFSLFFNSENSPFQKVSPLAYNKTLYYLLCYVYHVKKDCKHLDFHVVMNKQYSYLHLPVEQLQQTQDILQ